jgi:ParB-like chromosome segregation protein Spo0J
MLPIGDVQPYWRNPRRITTEAVEKVAASLEEYGWQQPIVVDRQNVIIVGHTRYEAARKLGMAEVPVLVSDLPDEKAREYRLVDNRTAELSGWDMDSLVVELREFEAKLLEDFFPEVDLRIGSSETERGVTADQVAAATQTVKRVTEADPAAVHTTTVVCPDCFHGFPVRTRSLPGLTREDLERLAYGTDGGKE